MRTTASLDPAFTTEGDSILRFKSPPSIRTWALQMGIVLSIIFYGGFGAIDILHLPQVADPLIRAYSERNWYWMGVFTILYILPIFSFIVWFFSKPTFLHIDRATQLIHLRTSLFDANIPWHLAQFRTDWIPTKVGGYIQLSLMAPLSEAGKSFIKDSKTDSGQKHFSLGLLSMKNDEDAARHIEFLRAFMSTDRSAEELYAQIVKVKGYSL